MCCYNTRTCTYLTAAAAVCSLLTIICTLFYSLIHKIAIISISRFLAKLKVRSKVGLHNERLQAWWQTGLWTLGLNQVEHDTKFTGK